VIRGAMARGRREVAVAGACCVVLADAQPVECVRLDA
jgi:hypothetical protein